VVIPACRRGVCCGLQGAAGTLSVAVLGDTLRRGLGEISFDVLAAFGELVPAGAHMPMLLQVTARLVTLVEGDYFSDEKVATWGVDGFGGLPENLRTYCRTVETPVTSSVHFYEFVVPMVPPTWNDHARLPAPARLAGNTRIGHRATSLKKAVADRG
jgi:hypothetical protein